MTFVLQLIIKYVDFDLGCWYSGADMSSTTAFKKLSPQAIDVDFIHKDKLSVDKNDLAKEQSKSYNSQQVHPDLEWFELNQTATKVL